MTLRVAHVGFGEAGMALASAPGAHGYDRKTEEPAQRAAMLAVFAAHGVEGCVDLVRAVGRADAILSLVTADQALAAAHAAAPLLSPGALWLDMNSVAPHTKRSAAAEIERAGGRYVDVAVMAPVNPLRRAVPLLVAGPHAAAARAALDTLRFSDVQAQPGPVGAAAAVKMIRSVMVKGIEALTAECVLAAEAAGVRDAVLASLGTDWQPRADYNLERMRTHGLRRAAEMEEAVATLDALGTGSVMKRATVERQREMGLAGAETASLREWAA